MVVVTTSEYLEGNLIVTVVLTVLILLVKINWEILNLNCSSWSHQNFLFYNKSWTILKTFQEALLDANWYILIRLMVISKLKQVTFLISHTEGQCFTTFSFILIIYVPFKSIFITRKSNTNLKGWPRWSNTSEYFSCNFLRILLPEKLHGCWVRWSSLTNYFS